MQQEPKIDSTTRNSLLDAPDSWVAQFISGQYLDSASKLSLSQTCRRLNEKVMQHSHSTSLHLDLLSRPHDKALNLLEGASKHAPSIRLKLFKLLENGRIWIRKPEQQRQMGHTVCSLVQAAAKQGATSAITEICLMGAWLDAILPPAIGDTCKALTKLSLHRCDISLDSTVSVSKGFQNLQSLELNSIEYYAHQWPAEGGSEHGTCMQHVCLQLKSLKALHSLAFVPWIGCHSMKVDCRIINALASQLTHLCLDFRQGPSGSIQSHLKPLDWVQLGASVRHLQLPAIKAGDEAMQVFLQMPQLTRLEVDCILKSSCVGQPCKWEELVCSEIDMQTLACLPLHPGLLLKVGTKNTARFVLDSGVSRFVQEAVVNVQRAKALKWAHDKVVLSAFMMEASEFAVVLAQAMPLIRQVKSLELVCGDLNGATMRSLCDFVSNRVDELCVGLVVSCHWDMADAVALVRHMPHNSTLELFVSYGVSWHGPNGEQQIIQLCGAAQQRLSLHARCPVEQSICEEHIRSAMQACGLGVITLQVLPAFAGFQEVFLTIQPFSG